MTKYQTVYVTLPCEWLLVLAPLLNGKKKRTQRTEWSQLCPCHIRKVAQEPRQQAACLGFTAHFCLLYE